MSYIYFVPSNDIHILSSVKSKQKEQHRDTDNIGYTRQNKH